MVKVRTNIPKAIRDSVLTEFNHRCAICGSDRPQIHHIDENPSNNDPMNLIPLCPNCHLVDQHNPTKSLETEKLGLFRQHKDPTILKPQFHPLYKRMKFLDDIEDSQSPEELERASLELADFIASLEMGAFYSKQVKELLHRPAYLTTFPVNPAIYTRQATEYREKLRKARGKVYALVVEVLRFQKW